MKFPIAIVLLLVSASLAPAQTNDVNLGDLLDTAQQWAQENLDGDVLAALQNVDREKVVAFLNQYQAGLQGDSVLDVAQLKVAAHAILPLLDAHEETQPYAAWLRARLNYFDAAEELKKLAPLPPPGTNAPPPLLNPTFAAERKIWIKEMAPEPWPKGAGRARMAGGSGVRF